jgi:hypothetical protein
MALPHTAFNPTANAAPGEPEFQAAVVPGLDDEVRGFVVRRPLSDLKHKAVE